MSCHFVLVVSGVAIACAIGVGCGAGGGGNKVNGDGGSSGTAAGGMNAGGTGNVGGFNLTDSGSGDSCNSLTVDFKPVTPTVLLLVDRSSSMFDLGFGPSPDRWAPLKEALVGTNG